MGVLVTRPDERGKELADMLNKAGVASIHLPFFSINAGRELNDLPNKYHQLKSGDYVFAVSRNAVHYANKTLRNTGFAWRKELNYFAVGQHSAEVFAATAEIAVRYPSQHEMSEGLLALPEMQQLEGKRILILRGNGGREYFAEQVKLRGAEVDIVECYQRVPIEYDNLEQTSICQRAGISTIIVTSVEILTYLMDFVPENEHNWLRECRLITISQRIAKQAQQFGWDNIIMADRADNTSLLQAVLNITNS